jgi:hypothetical protein
MLAHGNVAQVARKVDRVVVNAMISSSTFAHNHSATKLDP